jgi:N-acetylneuraminate synthase
MQIDNRIIDNEHKPYLIAEMSCNHAGKLEHALRLIDEAKASGADAVKIQAYDADSLTIDSDKLIVDGGQWHGMKLYDIYKQAATPWEWLPKLFKHADEVGITLISSVFCERGLATLEDLGCKAYKIARFESQWHDFIDKVADTGKPIIISDPSPKVVRLNNVAYLYCVSKYPTEPSDIYMNRVEIAKYYVPNGFSDHTLGNTAAVMAVAYGATIIEKHMCLPCVHSHDYNHSSTPEEMHSLRMAIDEAWTMAQWKPLDRKAAQRFSRSVYAGADIAEGEEFSSDNLRVMRPGYGARPHELSLLLGNKAAKVYKRGEPVHV